MPGGISGRSRLEQARSLFVGAAVLHFNDPVGVGRDGFALPGPEDREMIFRRGELCEREEIGVGRLEKCLEITTRTAMSLFMIQWSKWLKIFH